MIEILLTLLLLTIFGMAGYAFFVTHWLITSLKEAKDTEIYHRKQSAYCIRFDPMPTTPEIQEAA